MGEGARRHERGVAKVPRPDKRQHRLQQAAEDSGTFTGGDGRTPVVRGSGRAIAPAPEGAVGKGR